MFHIYLIGGWPLPKKLIPALSGRTVRCILFDLGDTLWSRKDMAVWEQVENASNTRAAALLKEYVTSPSLLNVDEAVLGKRLRESVDECLRNAIREEPDLEPHGGLAIVQVLHQWGIEGVDISGGEALRVRIPESRPLFDDVLPTLKMLQQRGFQLGVVSNRHWGGKLFSEDLQTLGLLDYFDLRHLAISVDLGVRKPNPAIFLHALNALNVAPEHAVMVGDSLLSDIIGGKMLGIFTIWKPKPSVRAQAHLIASGTAAQAHQMPAPAESTPGKLPGDLLPGMHITDDDYVLAQVRSRAGKWDQQLPGEVKPDLVIENLSDLLEIFSKVGKQ
jgi:HAD superfamily hydrolase (TIGR01509 family)